MSKGGQRIERVSPRIYSSTPTMTEVGHVVRRDYYPRLLVQHDEGAFHQWKIHIGDVVAVSTRHSASNLLTLEEIEDWEPNHLKGPSTHWKVGLIVALAHAVDIQNPERSTYECHLEWLEKALDTPHARQEKIKKHYRPYTLSKPTCQLPYLLLRSYSFDVIHPANILPVEINMMDSKEFQAGFMYDPDKKFSFQMCCRYWLDENSNLQPEGDIKAWCELNHSHFKKTKGTLEQQQQRQKLIPRPLQQAWDKWPPFHKDENLCLALIQKGFHSSANSKHQEHIHHLNRELQRDKARQALEEQELSKQQSQTQRKKRKIHNGVEELNSTEDSASTRKRVRIQEVDSPLETKKGVKRTKDSFQKNQEAARSAVTKLKAPRSSINKKTKSSHHVSSSSRGDLPPCTVSGIAESIVHSGKHNGQQCDFYVRVSLYWKQREAAQDVVVGQLVIIATNYETNKFATWEPFDRPWGVAQVTALFQDKQTKEWTMQARRLLRLNETSAAIQAILHRRKFDSKFGLLETSEIETLPVQFIMPAKIRITSDSTRIQRLKREDEETEHWFCCKHLLEADSDTIRLKKDWSEFSEKSSEMQGPLRRAFDCKGVHSRILHKYVAEFGRMASDSEGGTESGTVTANDLEVYPISTQPIYQRWGKKFYEGVLMEIDRASLHKDYTPQTQKWEIKVGFVIPIHFEEKDTTPTLYPFETSWSPAQVVAIYMNENNEWKMKIRWFYRFSELLPQHRKEMKRLNKYEVLFETEDFCDVDVQSALPGRIILTSSTLPNWKVQRSKISGLPLIPKLCTHICLDEDIDVSSDWTNYDLLLHDCPAPFTRGLTLNPRNRTNKEWTLLLSRQYTNLVKQRDTDPEQSTLRTWSGVSSSNLASNHKDIVQFDGTKTKAELRSTMQSFQMGAGLYREFSEQMKLQTSPIYQAEPGRRTSTLRFTVKVGDIVCFHDVNAGKKSDQVLLKNPSLHPWFPFRVPWSFGQVLTLYRDTVDDCVQVPRIEIRRLPRFSDLPIAVQNFAPLSNDTELEEIFESDDLLGDVPASSVLGVAQVYFGEHSKPANCTGRASSQYVISCRCNYFYHSSMFQFQPLFCESFSPETWFNRFRRRGEELSLLRKQAKQFPQIVAKSPESRSSFDVRKLLVSPSAKTGVIGKPIARVESAANDKSLNFFSKANVPISWNDVINSQALFHELDRDQTWQLYLGSIVAARSSETTPTSISKDFPFRGAWRPCQILAIYTGKDQEFGGIKVEVRFLSLTEAASGDKNVLSVVSLPPKPQLSTLECTDLIGPLTVVEKGSLSQFDWRRAPKRVPCALVLADNEVLNQWDESLLASRVYPKNSVRGVLDYLNTLKDTETSTMTANSQSFDKGKVSRLETDGHTSTAGNQICVDISKLRRYYSRLQLRSADSVQIVSEGKNSLISPWEIETGDAVLVHCDGPKRFPLNCNWGVAEVVAIWMQFQCREDLEKLESQTPPAGSGEFRVELRWFYSREDLRGLSGNAVTSISNEVFETDDVFELNDLTTILAPANLYADPEHPPPEQTFNDAPVQNFICRRFWSINRKSLVPCGGLEGRRMRAQLYSKNLPQNIAIPEKESLPVAPNATWRQSIRNVLTNLSLKEASRGVYERGDALVGRETELSLLLSFFRAAIRGEPGPGGVRSSIFLAGPPGVGKTACVRAAMAKLQAEQMQGDSPSFEFIALNAMEMKHPFEAYVKLLEALTGHKHLGSHDKACEDLEYYFTNPKSMETTEKSVTIVLLDEIDYLVTEKQSVLYNLFDWPKRAASIPNGRRLVVVGISNTLNLAEQLAPRVQSRVGSERIVFKAYNVADAQAILQSKIREASPTISIFDDDAIKFAAKKTAAMSGDIRKAFQICRAAAEQVLQRADEEKSTKEEHPIIRISDVQKASRQSFDTTLINAVSCSTPFQALLVVSLASLCRTTGREVGGFEVEDLLRKMETLVGSCGDEQYAPPPNFGETLLILQTLAENNLVKLHTAKSSSTSFRSHHRGSGGAWPMISLLVDEHTIARGLKSTPHKRLAEATLPSMV